MNANGREYVESKLTHRVVGCAMAVLNELGHGLREKTYERALCVEFRHQGYPKITGLQGGMILNFKRPRLEWKKVVLQERGDRG